VNSLEFLDDFFIPKTRVLGLSVGEDFVILARVIFTQCQRVTDRQTDGWTDGLPIVATLTPCKNAYQLDAVSYFHAAHKFCHLHITKITHYKNAQKDDKT